MDIEAKRQFKDGRYRPRGPITTSESEFATMRRWQRVIRGRTYSFALVRMHNGEVRWFVNLLTPYANYDARFACAWEPILVCVFR